MSDLSSKTALVFDHGLYLEMALRLSREFGRVLYYSPWEKGFPLVNDCIIGKGFYEIERCDDFWPLLDDIDCFVFCDVQHAGLQQHLESMGKNVWGSRDGDSLELERVKFLNTLKELGLPQPVFKVVIGMDELRKYLKEHEDKFIKISKYRGAMESWHHINYDLSEPMLDMLSVKFGAVQNAIPFLVCDPIETDIEVGIDTYVIDGQFPSIAIQGYESKDVSYISSVQRYADLPKEVTVVNEAFAPLLQSFRYRNFLSTEIRVKDGESYFIDPTMRLPSPNIESQYELYENMGEIIYAGSQGEMVDPVMTAKFAVQSIMMMESDKDSWKTIEVPDSIRNNVKLIGCCYINGKYSFPPNPKHEEDVGWMVGVGDTIQEAIDHLKENVELLGDCRVHVNVESLVDLLKEIETAEENDIPFTNQEIPSPESVIKE